VNKKKPVKRLGRPKRETAYVPLATFTPEQQAILDELVALAVQQPEVEIVVPEDDDEWWKV
jgi:hypothetical protein